MKSNHQILLGCLRTVTFLVSLLLLPCSTSASPYILEVHKSTQELIVKDGQEIIKRFHIAYGKGGYGTKRQSGDNKTPIGIYKIIDLRANSRFHFFMQINYPNSVDAWHGYRNNLISGQEFKEIARAVTSNAIPPQDTSLGGYIGLHGIGEITEEKLSIHDRHNWTEGCIALKNEEISELRQYVTIGTTILIKE
jgi:murein L,D-transpeptidase YafK